MHARAIDETWYKSAILQHQIRKESFVYSVPFDNENSQDILVTGSYAIFPKDSSMEAPGSVVGFQFSRAHFLEAFRNLANSTVSSCPDCYTCEDRDKVDCLLLDSNGYVVLSYKTENTGKFFGEVHPDVMQKMTGLFFEKITIYDFQALCLESRIEKGENKTYKQNIEKICEKQMDLFVLLENKDIDSVHFVNHNRKPFYIVKIPHSNLLLVVVQNAYFPSHVEKFNATPRNIRYDNIKNPCHKLILNDLDRRRLAGCYNEHPLVSFIPSLYISFINFFYFRKVQ